MIKRVFITLAVAVVGISIAISSQPSEFRIERSATLSAPPALVFEYVNDLHKWQEWSPWAKLDPAAVISYEGPVKGVGAAFSWTGNKEVGKGKMTVTESRAGEFIKFRLDFMEPFTATNIAEFAFSPDNDRTVVTWSMYGKKNFISKAVSLFMDCDKMVGEQFENGLVNLESVSGNSSGKQIESSNA